MAKYFAGMATHHHGTMCDLNWLGSVWWSRPDPMLKGRRKELNIFEIARPWPNISQEWPNAIMAQCVT
jgi:hypothetical protein